MKLIDMTVDTLIKQARLGTANPGGGATLILISNLAMNLALMMDKKDWGELKNQADVSYETILNTSEKYKIYMQADVDNFNALLDAYKDGSVTESHYIKASEPLINMIEDNLKVLDLISFYLENGKISTIVDGEVANDLLRQTIISAIPTIKINSGNIDYDYYIEKSNDLYNKNKEIIERRKK